MEADEKQQIIREIQAKQLRSLKKFDAVCKKYDIAYFLFWGTLIGAVRHHGFIPWDDDMDLGMMRSDYEKLCRVPVQEWGDEVLFIRPEENSVLHDKEFARLYVKGTKIQSARDLQWEDRRTGYKWYTSLMCDIYVCDYAPDDEAVFIKNRKKIWSLRKYYKLSKLKCCPETASVKSKVKCCYRNMRGAFLRLIYKDPWKHISDKIDRISQNGGGHSRICCYLDIEGETYQFLESDFFPLKTVMFEDMEAPIPNNYDKILRASYQEYMEYPPEEDRYHIPFIYIDLGEGKPYRRETLPGSLSEKDYLIE